MAGRTKYNAKIAARICDQLAHGKSLAKICKQASFPTDTTVYRWLDANPEFCDQYARARLQSADLYAAQIIELADKCRIGKKTKVGPLGTETTTGDMVERSRVQIDARKWYASKLAPKKYGEKVEFSGPNGGPIPIANLTADDLSDDQLAALVAGGK